MHNLVCKVNSVQKYRWAIQRPDRDWDHRRNDSTVMLFGCSWSTQTLRPHLATSTLWKERFQVEANHDASIGIKSNLKRRMCYRRIGKHGSGWAVYILVKAPLNIWISCISLTWLFCRIAHLKPPKWVLFPTASETICLHKADTCTFSQINKLKAFKLKNTHHSFPLQIRLRNYLYKVKQCYQTFQIQHYS